MSINSKSVSERIFKNLLTQREKRKHPVGWFQLFDLDTKKKMVYENHNLIVGTGRQYLAQKVLTSLTETSSGYSLTELPSGCDNYRPYDLTHYAFGSGGATYSGPPDEFTLSGPDICDTSLARPITFDVNTYLDDPGEVDEGDSLRVSAKSVKPIDTGNNSYEYFLRDYPIDDPVCSYYTQIQLTLFKEEGEFGPLEAGESIQVSEAGLYITYEESALLFARICFPPKFMEKEAQYGIEWYLIT